METKTYIFTYPEERLIYKEAEGVKTEVYLPEYVVNAIKEIADLLDAKVIIRTWWPYVFIFIEKDLAEQVDDCYDIEWSRAEQDALEDCEEKCGDDQECHEKCMEVWRYSVWRNCAERIGDEVRPNVDRAVNELDHVFKLYGIEAEVRSEWHHDMVEIKAKLKGYADTIPFEIGYLILAKIVDASLSKSYRDREKLAYKLTSAIHVYLSIQRLIKLATELDKHNIQITKMLDNYSDIRRYEMVIRDRDVKITLYVTEEKEDGHWAITDINVGAVEFAEVADLTSA